MQLNEIIKDHKIYNYIKDNNGLIIFFLTAFGTFITLLVRGTGYLYRAGRLDALNIPKNIVGNTTPYISLTVSVICTVIIMFACAIALITIATHKRLKKTTKNVSKKKYYIYLTIIYSLATFFVNLFNYFSITIQNIQAHPIIIYTFLLAFSEYLFMDMLYREVINNITFNKESLVVFVFLIAFAFVIISGATYENGHTSATSAKSNYQLVTVDNKKYVVLENFEEKFIIAECEEKDKTLTIHTDKQKIISYENVEYENKKFDLIKLE